MSSPKEVRLQQINVKMAKLQRETEANHRVIMAALHRNQEAPQNLVDKNLELRDQFARLGEEKQKLMGIGKLVNK